MSGELAKRPSSRVYDWFGTNTVTHNATPATVSLCIVANVASCRLHMSGHRWTSGYSVSARRNQSAHKCDPLLSFNLDCSRWLHRQLKNCSLLTFSHTGQERNLTVWKFQRIMMSRDLFLVDLPKDRRLVPDHLISPAKDTNRLAHDLASKRQFGSWSNADHHVRIF